jgi:hypothetical protein
MSRYSHWRATGDWKKSGGAEGSLEGYDRKAANPVGDLHPCSVPVEANQFHLDQCHRVGRTGGQTNSLVC